MSIRMIAKELYRLQQDLDHLENLEKSASPEQREGLKDRIRRMKSERDLIRRALEGKKGSPTHPTDRRL